jgi:hypothetical protein
MKRVRQIPYSPWGRHSPYSPWGRHSPVHLDERGEIDCYFTETRDCSFGGCFGGITSLSVILV